MKKQKRLQKRIKFQTAILKPTTDTFTRDLGNVHTTLKAAKIALRRAGGKKRIKVPRVIPIPKTGGFLIPLFAALSALGALAGGASSIAQAVNKAKIAQKELEEAKRHNKRMETITLHGGGYNLHLKNRGKLGLGLYIKEKKTRFKNFS